MSEEQKIDQDVAEEVEIPQREPLWKNKIVQGCAAGLAFVLVLVLILGTFSGGLISAQLMYVLMMGALIGGSWLLLVVIKRAYG